MRNILNMLQLFFLVVLAARDCLEFVHIPKTGGTSIEAIAAAKNITWGSCHFKHKFYKLMGCKPDLRICRINGSMVWHVPPRLTTKDCGITNYRTCFTFTVVRHPIEWAISHFYCKWWGPQKKTNIDDWVSKNHQNWIPQHEYLPVSFVLKYETITDDFNSLMGIFSLNLTLDRHQNKANVLKQSLSHRTICKVATHFKKDFATFGYEWPPGC